ncbi:cyclic nucleotide-binding domain-containing protein [Chitinophaga filiformis]|uniref:Crp/Fnr family transcriptional regulator n=1 Tax=Chitinophaga filiformis TaxID=104663 RepID=UPI001F414430|nr:cyclic nucleotide-binding domain-containing protein [Chitinophaga filiformis]MCF6406854.1 cyclic nucleotide-binding domain-containing protein [Chitinophaga filiformis]
MFECFEAYITSYAEFTKEELKYMRSLATEKKLRRRQMLLKEGEVCRHKVFVAKGLLRTYSLKDDGTEYILRFTPENNCTIVHHSYNNQVPSKYNIDALEETVIVMWTREDFEEIMTAIPNLRLFAERLKESNMDAKPGKDHDEYQLYC